jgi:chromosome segregation ATPase
LPASLLTLEEDVANDDTEDLDTKLAELDREIERFREQNRHLEGVQRECEVALDKVNREIREFERRKERETKDFEGWMNRERGQIQMERDEVGQQREDVERDRESIRFEREELEIIKD